MKKSTTIRNNTMTLLLALLFPLFGFGQSHFTPAINNGTGNWHIYPVLANLDGVALEAGDEIALFDGNVCVGARTLTAALDGSYTLAVGNDWIAYEKNGAAIGYTGDNTYSWRCWDASASVEYTGSMTYNTTYSPQDYVGTNFPSTFTFRWSWVDLSFTAVTPPSGDLTGTITNSVGASPIAGVSVTATGASTYVASSDGSGVYLFDDITPGSYVITTSHVDFQNHTSASQTVTDNVTTTYPITLTYKTGTLSGFVYDDNSDAVDGVTVTITGGQNATTNVNGEYSITGIAPGTYAATASKVGYADHDVTGIVIGANASVSQNFTIYQSGTLAGTVKNGGGTPEDGVLVTVVETGDNVLTAGGGLFTFDLTTGTYSLTFSKSGFHSTSSSSLIVSTGVTTTANKTIYAPNWTFTEGDPFSDVWTVYLNTITGDGTAVKAGDELSVWAPLERKNISAYAAFESGTVSSVATLASGSISSFDVPTGEGGFISSVSDNGFGFAEFASVNSLSNGNIIDIFGGLTYAGLAKTVANVTGTTFETGDLFGLNQTGGWVLSSNSVTEITSTGHGLTGTPIIVITNAGSYNGTYPITVIDANTFSIPVKWSGGTYISASWAINTSSIVTTGAAHGLSDGDNISISGTTNYNGTFTISNSSGSEFTINQAFVGSEAGNWANNANTTVTSTLHGRTNSESVTISGSTNYNGTYTISNVTANTFEITQSFSVDDATGKWVYGEQMVGLYYIDGPINGAGTVHDLKAFSTLNDASTGYVDGEDFVFKLWYAGGSTLTTLNSTTWLPGAGLIDPGTTFPSGNVFSQVNLDFDLPPGSFVVDFKDENTLDPDADLSLTLYKGGSIEATDTWLTTTGTAITFSSLDAGEYSLVVTSERFETITFTGIIIAPSTATTETYTVTHLSDETQTINLRSGYQLISRRVDDDSFDMSDYLAGTMSPTPPTLTNIDLTKDEDGTSDTYSAGVVTDGGVEWKIKRGYNFKMNATDAMVITGTPLTFNAEITIRTGFNMISYLPSYLLDAETAFASLMTADLDLIRDSEGNSLTKVGGVWVDHIGNCAAGEGFFIKWTGAPVTFTYPASAKSALTADEDRELVHFPFYNGYGNPMKDTYTMYIGGDDLEVGDEVAAYDGANLVGATVINSNNALDNNLNAFEELFDKDGFRAGNQIVLKVWKANEDTEYWLNFTNVSEGSNMYTGSVYPDSDGQKSTFDVTFSPNGISDNITEYVNVYPNPSSGIVNISSPQKIDRLIVVNIVGQTIINMQPESGNTKFSVEGLNSGIYFVNLIIDGQKISKKLSIQ